MGELLLMKGNEAIGEAAIRAGCQAYFAYPITPQNELGEYLARRMPEESRVFLQAESEVAAINMVYGAAGAGARAMTSSSSPGISLKQEGISYIAAAELPCVIVNMVRGGPGLGSIQPAQSDYFQATKGGGHGDYRLIVFGPSTIQELVDLTGLAFELADKYRNPVMILGDGALGQMMEPVEFPAMDEVTLPLKPWATTGMKGRPQNVINSLHLDPEDLDRHNAHLQEKYRAIARQEVRYELENQDADYFLVAYGTTARVARNAMHKAQGEGHRVGLIRPVTLWPFPDAAFAKVLDRARAFLTVEMSAGQMVEDVRLAVNGRAPVHFYGRTGGVIPSQQEIYEALIKIIQGGEKA
ncbi:MAG: 3-methyl-2-oxobutanoate dehydrogenase subunit VorB [Firmicutes bacterium]|nr:3-methyl-2-oxobutanoate dehydrogenase subunit VorB [Bacillota bacterium]